jgi:hypothetical protein
MTTTGILAVIGGITLILTTAARIPTALAEFLRACILVAAAARDLRTALTRRASRDDPAVTADQHGPQPLGPSSPDLPDSAQRLPADLTRG